MNWEHLRALHKAGWCIAPHTRRHLWLAGPERAPSDMNEAAEELAGSKARVEEQIGVASSHFAYPNGSFNTEVESLVKKVFATARLWTTTLREPWPMATRQTDPYRLVGINVSEEMDHATFQAIVDAAAN
jgi:hypothetical protein